MKDGHLTKDPVESNFIGVIFCKSAQIVFAYTALNGLEVYAADIKSTCLQAPTSEKHCVICDQEFPLEYWGCCAIIKKALYGGKSTGTGFWKHMRSCINHLGFAPCKVDPDVWMCLAKKDCDRSNYWEYVLLCMDDALCISVNSKAVLKNEIGHYWKLKKGSIRPPTIYLGNKITKVVLENIVSAWSFSSAQYVQEAVKNVELHLQKICTMLI